MSGSREDSPDWLRSFQAPTHSAVTLSSGSDSDPSPNGASPPADDVIISEFPDTDSNIKSEVEEVQESNKKKRKRKTSGDGDDDDGGLTSEKQIDPHAAIHSVWTLSSDSESCPNDSTKIGTKKGQVIDNRKEEQAVVLGSGEEPLQKDLNEKSPKKSQKVDRHTPKKVKHLSDDLQRRGNLDDVEVASEDTSEKHNGSHVSTSRLPLVLSEKVHRSKALVECEGDSIDLSGDVGAVGRIVISDTQSGNSEMYLDLKGTIYKTTIVPSRTFCIVSFGQSEAKIEAIMNDFIQLKSQSNVYEAETMVEGTLEGFSFGSEDEGDRIPKADHNEGNEEPVNGKTKGKSEKLSGVVRKKGKAAGGKPQPAKKVRKKTQASKKAKTKR